MNYRNVFVHGLSGWGSYDAQNLLLKYWGLRSGDLLKQLEAQGFECYAASVDPQGSAWDRACELYAQLTGGVTDYGVAHSTRHNHERYGKDFRAHPLITQWDAERKINLLGHSFGGATVRLLAELMAHGSEEERAATTDGTLSPLFTGGKADWIYSITALASPHNGTTAYEVDEQQRVGEGVQQIRMEALTKLMFAINMPEWVKKAPEDDAHYDMKIDNAMRLNEKLPPLPEIYYFSVPCNAAVQTAEGTYVPDEKKNEALFLKAAFLMGCFTGTTPAGYTVDERWQMNDGLVNTFSATAPFNAPQTPLDEAHIARGVWNVFPVYYGDHLSICGGLSKKNDVQAFYVAHLNRLRALEKAEGQC